MIMTEHAAPRLSARGLTLAFALAVGGCIVTPLLANTTSEKDVKQKQSPAKRLLSEHEILNHAPKVIVPADDHALEFEKFTQARKSDSAKQRIERLKHQIQQLKKELERIHKASNVQQEGVWTNSLHEAPPILQKPLHVVPHASSGLSIEPQLPRRLPRPPKPTRPPNAPKIPGTAASPRIHIVDGQFPASVIAQGGPGRIAFATQLTDSNNIVAREYKLTGGKLKALTELMIRQDVPIIVSPNDEFIVVHANHAQHMIFSAFVKMIGDNEKHKVEYVLSQGKLEALIKLMSRSDVPIIIEPRDDEIVVHGNALEQAIFGAFVNMIGQANKVTAAESADSPFSVAIAKEGEWAELAEQLRNAAGQIRKSQAGEWATLAEKLQVQADQVLRENGGNWNAIAQRYQEAAGKVYSDQMNKWADAAKIYELEAGQLQGVDLEKILASLKGQIQLSTEHAQRMALEAMKVTEMAEMLEGEIESIVAEAMQEIEEGENANSHNNNLQSMERMIKKLMKQIKALKLKAADIEDEADKIEGEADILRGQADKVQKVISQVMEKVDIAAASNC